jgi:hypothetical protein
LDGCAGGVHDRSAYCEVPGDGEIAPEDALFLAAFDQRLYLVEHRDVTPCKGAREFEPVAGRPAGAGLLPNRASLSD